MSNFTENRQVVQTIINWKTILSAPKCPHVISSFLRPIPHV